METREHGCFKKNLKLTQRVYYGFTWIKFNVEKGI